MAKIQLTPAELTSQSKEMLAIQQEYASISKKTISILESVNSAWSENIANNFTSKIVSAQKSLDEIETFLGIGATMALTSAKSFENIDTLLANEMKKNTGNLSLYSYVQNWINNATGHITNSNPSNIPNTNGTITVNPGVNENSPEGVTSSTTDQVLINWDSNKYFINSKVDLSNYSVVPGLENLNGYDLKQKPKMCTAYTYWYLGKIYGAGNTPNSPDGLWIKGAGAAGDTSACNPATKHSTSYTSEMEYLEFTIKNLSSGVPVGVRVNSNSGGHTMACVGLANGASWDSVKNMSVEEIKKQILVMDPADGQLKSLDQCKSFKIGCALWTPDGAPVVKEPAGVK